MLRKVTAVFCICIPFVLIFSWFIFVPLYLTFKYNGKVGTTKDGRQIIVEFVEPCPSWCLWCFVGEWQFPEEKIVFPDGSELTHGPHNFTGRCYLDYIDFDEPLKKLEPHVWDLREKVQEETTDGN